MTTSKIKGNNGEEAVSNWLKSNGYNILERNYYSNYGEIDIIAIKNDTIAFVEVKTRKQNSMISAAWEITKNKQSKIIKTALLYMQKNDLDMQIRFDVCLVMGKFLEIDYYENAFESYND